MIVEACVFKLGEVDSDFRQNIVELEAKILPSATPELLEEW